MIARVSGNGVGRSSSDLVGMSYRNSGASSGTGGWSAPTGDGPQSPPIVVGNIVFASGGKSGITAFDAVTGKVLWSTPTGGSTYGSPSEAAGILFATDGSSLVAWGP